jgi:hypothetical protein
VVLEQKNDKMETSQSPKNPALFAVLYQKYRLIDE